jgi:hypothetical protein
MTDDKIEHGAAEDGYGVPVTPTDVEASRTPPSQPSDPDTREAQEAAGRPSDDDQA